MEPNFLKSAIEEDTTEQLSEEEVDSSLDVVNADPDDYYEEEYEDEDDEYSEYEAIGSGSWEDFVEAQHLFQSLKETIANEWDTYSEADKKRLTGLLISLRIESSSTCDVASNYWIP